MNNYVFLTLNFKGWLRAVFTGKVKLPGELVSYIAAHAEAFNGDDDE